MFFRPTERIEQSKVEDPEPVVCKRELSARPNQKLQKNQWWLKQFGLEAPPPEAYQTD